VGWRRRLYATARFIEGILLVLRQGRPAAGALRTPLENSARHTPRGGRRPDTQPASPPAKTAPARRRNPPLDRDVLQRAKREIAFARMARALGQVTDLATLPAARIMIAVRQLELDWPQFSARHGLTRGQALGLVFMLAGGAIAMVAAPILAASMLMLAATAVFLLGAFLRLFALVSVIEGARRPLRAPSLPALPTYAVLVPLYRETAIVPDTIAAMQALDYPADRLDILLVCEDDDADMLAVIDAIALPALMRVVAVPAGNPRTKPKALNYALTDVTADLVVIYDAEDVPEPDQLRCAAARFLDGDGRLGCLQARLNIYNVHDGWLTRQFTLEYSALFDGLLPALQRLRLPIPLGGTSNHFRRAVLEDVGAWDPYNVTEDADLGLRLRRRGWRVETLRSTTFEEAPQNRKSWCKQRSRWIKGWLQTYAVHMRHPVRLLSDFGVWPFVGFQLLALGLLATVYLHPLAYVLIATEFVRSVPFETGGDPWKLAIWWLAAINLMLGLLSTMLLAGAAVLARGHGRLLLSLPLMPVYWLLMSFAAYFALFQLLRETRRPIRWEKTAHRAREAGEGARPVAAARR
jgi:cellulose synthase/poly-beta-1,6-N-acetylglucosamine synthase-like glycosyltransferase